jgi:hypothetical protein
VSESPVLAVSAVDSVSASYSLKDVKWLADFLGVSKSWVYQACAGGRLPCVRVGAALRFDPHVITSWVRGEKVGRSVALPSCR